MIKSYLICFTTYKSVGDWQSLLGINVRCPHLSWYTMKGEGKRDYPASISVQSAWYKECKYISRGYTNFDWEYEDACDAAIKYCLENLI